MPDVYALAEEYRARILDLDSKAAAQMAAAYRPAYAEMQRRLGAVTQMIKAAQDAGEPVPPAWLFQQERWREAYAAIRDQITKYNAIAKGIVQTGQSDAIDLGQAAMARLLGKSMPPGAAFSFTSPNDAAMQAMVGFASDGSPLMSLFSGLAPEAATGVRAAMLAGMATGMNPLVMAKQFSGPLSIPLWRSLTIARTETTRAYREANRQTMLANSDVLEGWVWHAALDPRTCSACWAMHGKLFPIVDVPAADAAALTGHQMAAVPGTTPDPLEQYYRQVEAAKQQWVTPGQDYAIRTAARDLMNANAPEDAAAGESARLLMNELNRAPILPTAIYRGEQLGHLPDVGSSISRPLSSWGNEATAQGYSDDPAGAAVYGRGQTGHKVVFEMYNARAVPMPDLEEYLSGGSLRVVGSRKQDGYTYLTVQQTKTYEPRRPKP